MRVGIDLGTTYSTVAYFDKNLQKPMIIKNKYGSNITPSVVGFTRDGKAKYGDDAKELQEFNEGDTASFYKREMGNTAFKLKLNCCNCLFCFSCSRDPCNYVDACNPKIH